MGARIRKQQLIPTASPVMFIAVKILFLTRFLKAVVM